MGLPQTGQGRALHVWASTLPSPLPREVCAPPVPGVDGETEASGVKGLPATPASGHGARALGGGVGLHIQNPRPHLSRGAPSLPCAFVHSPSCWFIHQTLSGSTHLPVLGWAGRDASRLYVPPFRAHRMETESLRGKEPAMDYPRLPQVPAVAVCVCASHAFADSGYR